MNTKEFIHSMWKGKDMSTTDSSKQLAENKQILSELESVVLELDSKNKATNDDAMATQRWMARLRKEGSGR